MKKLLLVAVVLALSVPVVAFGGTPYTDSFKEGKYRGTITSVVPDLNGKKVEMVVVKKDGKIEAKVTGDGVYEIWTWTDKELFHKEIDPATGKEGMTYGATATKPATTNSQAFNVNCKNKTKNECDAGADARFYWELKSSPSKIDYIVYGVAKEEFTKPEVQAKKRHTFSFTQAQ